MDLSTAEDCYGAVNYAKSFNNRANYKASDFFPESAKGCIITDLGDMFFNTASTGGRYSYEASICKKGNA